MLKNLGIFTFYNNKTTNMIENINFNSDKIFYTNRQYYEKLLKRKNFNCKRRGIIFQGYRNYNNKIKNKKYFIYYKEKY